MLGLRAIIFIVISKTVVSTTNENIFESFGGTQSQRRGLRGKSDYYPRSQYNYRNYGYGPGYRRPPAYPYDTYNPYTSWFPFNYPAYTFFGGNPYLPGILGNQIVYPWAGTQYNTGGVGAQYNTIGGTAPAATASYVAPPQSSTGTSGANVGTAPTSGSVITATETVPPPPTSENSGAPPPSSGSVAPPPAPVAGGAPPPPQPQEVHLSRNEVMGLFPDMFDVTQQDVADVLEREFGMTDPFLVEKAIDWMVAHDLPVRGVYKAHGPVPPTEDEFLILMEVDSAAEATLDDVRLALALYYNNYDFDKAVEVLEKLQD